MKRILALIISMLTVCMMTGVAMAEAQLKEADINPAYIEYWKLSGEERSKRLEPPMTLPKIQEQQASTYSILRSTSDSAYSSVGNYVTSVKDQGARGVCWTFSSIAMLESYMLRSSQGTYDFSEKHMDYSTSYYSDTGAAYADGKYNEEGFLKSAGSGGNILYSMPYLFREQGVVLESTMSYNDTTAVKVSDLRNAASANVWVKDYAVYPSYSAGYMPVYGENAFATQEEREAAIAQDEANAEAYRNTYINQVKSHIKQYGAMDVTMNVSNLFSSDMEYYYSSSNTANKVDHAVTVVGWDDTVEASKFKPDQPKRNGAWIVKNSWGTKAHGDGYFYMSYEDKSLYQVNAGVLSAKANKDYKNVYSYDTFGHNARLSTNGTGTIYAANVFEAKESGELLKSITVGFDSAASVTIYVNPDGGMENVSNMVQVATGSFGYEGYKTFDLANPVTLNGGPFAVVVKYQYGGSSASIPVEGKYTGTYQNVVANRGESYWSYAGGQWIDLSYYGNPANCSIKAFTYEPDIDTVVYPGNLKAQAISNSEIKLTWNKVTDATKYEIFTRANTYDEYASIGFTTDTTSIQSDLLAGTTYFFKVKAYKNNSQGKEIVSELSNQVSATTLKNPTLSGLSVSGSTNINQTVTLEAYVDGYASGVQYKFSWSHSNGSSGVIANYSTNNTVNYKLTAAGKYTFKVEAKTANGSIGSKTVTTTCVDPNAFTLTGITLPAKANSGQTITVKATASGATAGLQYQFLWKTGTKSGTIRNYGTGNSVSFKLPYAGTYTFTVNAKSKSGIVSTKTATFTAGDPSNFSVTKVNAPTLSWVGNTATISASVSGNTYGLQYKFVWSYNNWSDWGVIQSMSARNSASFKPNRQGTYDFYVDVKATNGKTITKYARCKVMGANYFAVNRVNVPSTGKIGQTVTINPSVSGNTSGLQYKFVWSYNNWSSWGVIRSFSTTKTASYKLQKAGKYTFYVDVRGRDGKVITKTGSITVTDPYAFNLNSITAPASGKVGQWINVKANASGYTAGMKYKFVWSYNNWSKWGVAKGLTAGNTSSVQLKYPGKYDIYVDAKGANGKTITKKVSVVVSLGWAPKSIGVSSTRIKLGNTVRITGYTTGGTGIQYKFVWAKNNWKNWGVIKSMNATNTTIFKPTSKGTYTIYMDVRDTFGNTKTITRKITVY